MKDIQNQLPESVCCDRLAWNNNFAGHKGTPMLVLSG